MTYPVLLHTPIGKSNVARAWSHDKMAGYYNAGRDPRQHSADIEGNRIEEVARKRQRMDTTPGAEVEARVLTGVDRHVSNNSSISSYSHNQGRTSGQ